MTTKLPIGQVALESGVKVPTIRYCEQIGLLATPPRSEGNRRQYGPEELKRLAFIRHARELGFDVEAIKALLSLQDRPEQSCSVADAIARARLVEVRDRIAKLRALERELERMADHCAATGTVARCHVIETLADPSHEHGRLAD